MPDISSITGIGKDALSLLEVAGFDDLDSLANASADELHARLTKANDTLHITKQAPSEDEVESWIQQAQAHLDHETTPAPENQATPDSPPPPPANYELTPELRSLLARAPLALPLPAKLLVEHSVAVATIPEAILTNRHEGDLEMRVTKHIPQAPYRRNAPPAPSRSARNDSGPEGRLHIDTSRVRMAGEALENVPIPANFKAAHDDEHKMRMQAPRPETNKGRSRHSRSYIRGVLHNRPVMIYSGALITLCTLLLIPLACVSTVLLIIANVKPEALPWAGHWLLIPPCALVLFSILWLFVSFQGSCRVCGQKLFVHRHHRKNAKAHHIKGLGYIIPLCVHILLFRWFRCTHCGTPIRLKE